MKVTVRLFASYREAAGRGRFEIDLPPGATVRDAVGAIAREHPLITSGRQVVIARNREYVDGDTSLDDGDEIALIPPVSGGSVGVRGKGPPRGAGAPPPIAVTPATLSIDAVLDAVRAPGFGAIVVFLGTVRDESRGKAVTHLEYEAYAEMAEAKMRELATRLERAHAPCAVAMHHRVGDLTIGEVAVVVAAAAPHRDAAFAAAREGIDELKRTVPIWKREHSADGAIWIEEHA